MKRRVAKFGRLERLLRRLVSAAAFEVFNERGVKFDEEIRPAAGGGRVLFFEDGEGNLLHPVRTCEGFLWRRSVTAGTRKDAALTERRYSYFFCARTRRMGIEVL